MGEGGGHVCEAAVSSALLLWICGSSIWLAVEYGGWSLMRPAHSAGLQPSSSLFPLDPHPTLLPSLPLLHLPSPPSANRPHPDRTPPPTASSRPIPPPPPRATPGAHSRSTRASRPSSCCLSGWKLRRRTCWWRSACRMLRIGGRMRWRSWRMEEVEGGRCWRERGR